MTGALFLWLWSSVQAAPVDDPQIVVESGRERLLLPDSLLQLVGTQYPGFRVPDDSDLKEEWTYDSRTYPPFAAWGDFNGDGLTDVALILISNNAFELIILNKAGSSYNAAFETGNNFDPPGGDVTTPQQLFVSVLPEGRQLTFQSLEPGDSVQFVAQDDSVQFGIFEGGAPAIIYWTEGEYKVLVIRTL